MDEDEVPDCRLRSGPIEKPAAEPRQHLAVRVSRREPTVVTVDDLEPR